MQPLLWHPPVALSPAEHAVFDRIKRGRLFRFLRVHRLTLFSDAFQSEFAVLYADSRLGQPSIPPAQLALALILQAYTGCSDDELIEALTMDLRWQLVLDCLGCTTPPFSKGTFVTSRNALLPYHLDRRLLERTLEIAQQTGAFNPRALRGALDSSPLGGAGRVEDTYNLLGHAMRKTVDVLAAAQGREPAAVAAAAGAALVSGSSLKAGLDCNWDDPRAGEGALRQILWMLEALTGYVARHAEFAPEGPRQLGGGGAGAGPRCRRRPHGRAGVAPRGGPGLAHQHRGRGDAPRAQESNACASTATSGMC